MHLPQKPAKGQPIRAELIGQIIDCLRMFRPIPGVHVRVDTTPGGSIISCTAAGGGSVPYVLAPFTVRHHVDQWEIYVPSGSVNVGGTCAPINPVAAGSGDAHENDPEGWLRLDLDESSGTTGRDGDGNTYREWTVTVHAKTRAKVWQVDDLNAPARRLVWIGVTDRLKPYSSMSDAELYKDAPGDGFSCDVALIRVTAGETGAGRKVTQLRSTPVYVNDVPAPTGFDLVWYFSVADGALKVEHVYCLRQLAAVAGIAVTGNQMTDVTDADKVYARIDSSDMTDGTGILSVVTDPSGDDNPSVSNTLITWLPLYELTANTVTADYRENSLKNVQLYRS